MEKFRKIWNEETDGFLVSHRKITGTDYDRLLKLFLEAFPDSRVTKCAIKNECSRLRLCKPQNPHPTRHRPLYSEHLKKGYVRIKIAEPNVWVSKSKWVYMETHPWEDFSERSNYIFLDGDTRNFSPENIERVPLKLMGIYNLTGGVAKGCPELTRVRIAQARLKQRLMDSGEKVGLVVVVNGKNRHACRVFKSRRNELARTRYRMLPPEKKKEINENRRQYFKRLREETPEKWEALKVRRRESQKAYYQRHKDR